MNEECRIRIDTYAGAEGSEVANTTAQGWYSLRDEKHRVRFGVSNDRCRVEFDEEGLYYARSGELSFEMRLRPGQKSMINMKTSYGDVTTAFEVDSYAAEIGEETMKISTAYHSEDEKYRIEIEVTSIPMG